jgi:acyl-CoA oxidase
MVFARLIIEDNDYGVMPFMVQLRDLDTWMPVKGVECGDMGPKMGYHSKNNGWCTFDQVRIPREWMPMKFVSVDKEGTFSIEGDMRALYSVMMDIRTQLVQHSGLTLQRALLIGMRYSAVRRQFKNTSGSKQETKLIDYQTQQMKHLPLLGCAYGMLMSHTFVVQKY